MSEFIEAMGQLAGGVAVVTVRDGRDDIGNTVTTLLSISAEPPLLLVSLTSVSYLAEVLLAQDRWAVTLLAAGQQAVASRFATPGRPGARLLVAGTPHHRGEQSGGLIIDGGVAAIEAETTQVIPAGDHTLFLAAPIGVDYIDTTRQPLVRLRSRYREVGG